MGTSSSTLGLIASVRSLGDPAVPVTLDSHELWRGLFTSSFTVVDLDTVVTGQYVRTLRMYQPERLAALLFKCITQLHAFASSQCCVVVMGGGGGANTNAPAASSPMPPTQSVINALMMIGRVLPFLFEDLDDVVQRDAQTAKGTTTTTRATGGGGGGGGQAVSPIAREFTKAFFLYNRTCQLDLSTFPDLEGGGAGLACNSAPRHDDGGDREAPSRPAYPLGQCLVDCLVQLCFVPNFTMPATTPRRRVAVEGDGTMAMPVVLPELLWFKGVGSVSSDGDATSPLPGHGPSSTLLGHLSDAFFASVANHRRLILHTLLVVLSAPLHRRQCIVKDPIFCGPLTQNSTTMLFPTLVASMLNAVVSYNPRGRLPYTSHMITAAEHVVVLSAQVLCVVLGYASLLSPAPAAPSATIAAAPTPPRAAPPREDDSTVGVFKLSVGQEEDENDGTSVSTSAAAVATSQQHASDASSQQQSQKPILDATLCRNQAWRVMCSMTEREAKWVIEGLAPLFSNVTFSKSTYLPQSQRQLFESDQLLVLLWKLVDRCDVVRGAFGTTPAALSYVVPLCYYLLQARDDAKKKFSVAQIAMFIVLKLSASRDFVVLCNEPFSEFIPFSISEFSHGTYNDLIALSLMAILQAKTDAAHTLQTSCGTALANMAPFMTSVSLGTSQRLVWQLESFGRMSCLLDNPRRNGKLLMLAVEAVASLLQYQYRGCGHLAYTIVRTRDALRGMLNIFVKEGNGAAAGTTTKITGKEDEGDEATGDHPHATTSRHQMALSELTAPEENADDVEAYRRKLLLTLRCAIDRLEALVVPVVQSMDLIDIPTYIANKTTLVGALPVPHSIVVRKYGSTFDVDEWVSRVMWGFIFSHAVPGTLIAPSSVRLFGFA